MLTRFAKPLLMGLLLAALQGCGTGYLTQAARGQWRVMRERQPIERMLADERTPASLRARLEEVRAVRDFASRELLLPDNASYRSYADIGRPFVVWNVVATAEFSVEPQKWCFPIAGCVAYRGYFSEQKAQAFAARLRSRGSDVMVAGVPAYSTLGRTADPVLNTMLRYGDTELAAIIFHELSHQLVYVAGDSDFNEAFATTVEQAGLQLWLEHRGRQSELARYATRKRQQQEYMELLASYRRKLAKVYALPLKPAAMREKKQTILAALAGEIRSIDQRESVRSPYSAWIGEGLNNAQLASVATYFDCVPGFERLLQQVDGSLGKFFAAAREAAGQPRAERHSQLCTGPGQDQHITNR
jgi:predicted aminopeptidase